MDGRNNTTMPVPPMEMVEVSEAVAATQGPIMHVVVLSRLKALEITKATNKA